MNSPRLGARPVTWKWRPVLLYAFLLLGCAPLLVASQKPVRKARSVQSDVAPLQDQRRETPKDLLLTPDGERKADALASFIEGSLAEDNADADKALEDYRKVLAVDPAAKVRTEEGDEPLMLLAAKVAFELARRGDPAAGIDILKDTVKAAPDDPMACYFLSQLYSKFLKKYDIALKYASQALALDPDDFLFYVANYELEINLGQPKKAAQVLERATKLQNDDPEFWLKLSELHVHTMVKDDGTSAPEDLKQMNALFQKTLSLAKDDPEVIAKVADFYVLTKQVKDAIPLYLKVLDLKRNSTDPLLANVREKLASSFLATGQRDEAIKVLEDLIKENPMRYGTYELLGKLFEGKGDFGRALANYQQMLLINPNNYQNYLHVADMLMQGKKYDKAVEVLREAHKNFADLPRVTYALAQALSLAKKHQEAMTAFEEARDEAANSDSEMLNGEFYFSYGAAAEQAGLIDKAAGLFKKTIELDPAGSSLASPGAAYNYLGFMWVDRNQNLDEGGDLIKRALEMEPDNAAYIDSLGWYYYKKGEPEKALTELLKAVSLTKPEDSVVYDHVGDTYQKLGNTAQALAYWQKAVALDPASSDNKPILEKIENAKQKMTSGSPVPDKPADKR